MSIAQNQDAAQAVSSQSHNPRFPFGGKVVKSTYVASDPLTGRAYFDAHDITVHVEAEKRHQQRALRNRVNQWMEVKVHADLLDFSAVHGINQLSPGQKGGGTRGTITGFSRASRKRMIEYMAKVRFAGQILFGTFTYPDAFPINKPDVWNAHFEALRRRIERQYPNYRIIWRKELKERKSGDYAGFVAPHYHMLIDTCVDGEPSITVEKYQSYGKLHDKTTSALSRQFERWSLKAWYEIVGSNDEKHRKHGSFVVACRNRRHAYKYISKYVAKEENDTHEVGRRWGRIGNWNTKESATLLLTRQEVIELKRLIRSWMKSKKLKFRKFLASMPVKNGFSVLGIGDEARTGNLWFRLLYHASQLAGEMPVTFFQLE